LTRSPEEAAEFILRGGLAAFPTETVYGLGADVFNEAAVLRIFKVKRRPADNPLIAHISDLGQIRQLTPEISEVAQILVSKFFPGPLTVVLPRAVRVPLAATAGLDSIGIRMPRHQLASEFLRLCQTPIVAPSANLSGRPSPTSWQAVVEDLSGEIECILQGDDTEIGLESTVVDCTADVPVILRPGAVTIEELKAVAPTIVMAETDLSTPVRSPGMKHKHYSPRARVILVGRDSAGFGSGPHSFIGLHEPSKRFDFIKICRSLEEYAHSLYEFFRESDRNGIVEIYCETVDDSGIGTAIMDRLRRASEN
jgi:L-threonylcarbamoyladenylate synthase